MLCQEYEQVKEMEALKEEVNANLQNLKELLLFYMGKNSRFPRTLF